MKTCFFAVIALAYQGLSYAHPGHHHQPGISEVHGLFSWEYLVWVGVLAVVAAIILRSR